MMLYKCFVCSLLTDQEVFKNIEKYVLSFVACHAVVLTGILILFQI